jgi:hypothetical protein
MAGACLDDNAWPVKLNHVFIAQFWRGGAQKIVFEEWTCWQEERRLETMRTNRISAVKLVLSRCPKLSRAHVRLLLLLVLLSLNSG